MPLCLQSCYPFTQSLFSLFFIATCSSLPCLFSTSTSSSISKEFPQVSFHSLIAPKEGGSTQIGYLNISLVETKLFIFLVFLFLFAYVQMTTKRYGFVLMDFCTNMTEILSWFVTTSLIVASFYCINLSNTSYHIGFPCSATLSPS